MNRLWGRVTATAVSRFNTVRICLKINQFRLFRESVAMPTEFPGTRFRRMSAFWFHIACEYNRLSALRPTCRRLYETKTRTFSESAFQETRLAWLRIPGTVGIDLFLGHIRTVLNLLTAVAVTRPHSLFPSERQQAGRSAERRLYSQARFHKPMLFILQESQIFIWINQMYFPAISYLRGSIRHKSNVLFINTKSGLMTLNRPPQPRQTIAMLQRTFAVIVVRENHTN